MTEEVTKDDKKQERSTVQGAVGLAANIVRTLMGGPDENKITTVKIKKEKANENDKYGGKKTQSKEDTNESNKTPKRGEIIDMTTPTTGKRKKAKITLAKPNNGSGNEKKKPKQQQLMFTPKCIVIEREEKGKKTGRQRKRDKTYHEGYRFNKKTSNRRNSKTDKPNKYHGNR